MKKQDQTFDWSRKDPSTQVVYDYSDSMEIYPKTQIVKTFANDGYLKVLFPTDSKQWSRPHLTIRDTSYHLSALTILAKPRPELVLEHTPMTNGSKIFVRIPLTVQNSLSFFPQEETCLDHLASNKASVIPCDLNSLIGKGSQATLYKGSTLLYWKTPISIKTDLSTLKNAISPWTEMELPTYNQDYRIVSAVGSGTEASSDAGSDGKEGFQQGFQVAEQGFQVAEQGFQEGFNEEEYDCKIVDESEDQVNLMQIPYLSDSLTNVASKNMMQGVLYLFYMGIIVLLGVFLLPGAYKTAIKAATGNAGTDTAKYKAFQCFIWVTGILIFLTSLMFLSDGVVRGNNMETGFGLIMTFLVVIVLTFIKINNHFTTYKEGSVSVVYEPTAFIKDSLNFLIQPLMKSNAVGDSGVNRDYPYERFSYLIKLAVFSVIIFVVSFLAFPKDAPTFSPAFYLACIFLIFSVTLIFHYLLPKEFTTSIGGFDFLYTAPPT